MRFRVTGLLGICFCCAAIASGMESAPNEVLATVNGQPITAAELQAEFFSRRIPAEQQAKLRDAVLNDLIDRRLIEMFLDKRKAPVPERELQAQLDLLRQVVEKTQGEFEPAIAALGFTEETLRRHLGLPLRWEAYVRRTITDQQLRDYFEMHRAKFDGTEVRASQIVISLAADAGEAEWSEAESKLKQVRDEIEAGKLTFEEAARQHSTSPSGKEGGDLGYFAYRGRLPEAVTSVAFALKAGELSGVFRSPFGVHLLRVTDRKPGDLSLEDVRAKVWDELADELWREHVERERSSARIRITASD